MSNTPFHYAFYLDRKLQRVAYPSDCDVDDVTVDDCLKAAAEWYQKATTGANLPVLPNRCCVSNGKVTTWYRFVTKSGCETTFEPGGLKWIDWRSSNDSLLPTSGTAPTARETSGQSIAARVSYIAHNIGPHTQAVVIASFCILLHIIAT